MRCLTVVMVLLLLVGCDAGPGIRQNLAQCKLAPEAKHPMEAWDNTYLANCMQARGYRLDRSKEDILYCSKLPHPAASEDCYRRDDWLANFPKSRTPSPE